MTNLFLLAPAIFLPVFWVLWRSRRVRPFTSLFSGLIYRALGAVGPHELLITEKEFIESNGRRETRVLRDRVKRIEVTDKHAFLYPQSYSALVIPLSCFDDSERSALLRILER